MGARRALSGVFPKIFTVAALAISMTLATVPAAGQDDPAPTPALQPDEPSAQWAAAVTEASTAYLEVYFRVWIREPQLGIYFNNGLPFELSGTCTAWGVAPNVLVSAAHCVEVDVRPGTAAHDVIVGPATDQAIAANLYPGLTRAEIQQKGVLEWEAEGEPANSLPELDIFVSYGVVTSGLRGQQGTATARVLDLLPIDEGDVALIRIEDPGSLAAAPVPVLEIAEGTPAVGTDILTAGYPGAVGQVTTGQQLSPSVKDGRISSVTNSSYGGYQVFEVSSAGASGMSGGPTVDFFGRAIGVNSFGVFGEGTSFAFVSPVERYVGQLLARNGIDNELSTTDELYRQGLVQFFSGYYTDAIEAFDQTLERFPSHRLAQEYRIQAVTLRDEVGDTPPPVTEPPVTEPPVTEAPSTLPPVTEAPTTLATPTTAAPASDSDDGDSSMLPVVLIVGGIAVIAALGIMYVRRNQMATVANAPAALPPTTGQPQVEAPPATAPPDQTTAPQPVVEAEPAPSHAGITEELSTLAKLHEAGDLSDDEFAELKRKLLDDSP